MASLCRLFMARRFIANSGPSLNMLHAKKLLVRISEQSIAAFSSSFNNDDSAEKELEYDDFFGIEEHSIWMEKNKWTPLKEPTFDVNFSQATKDKETDNDAYEKVIFTNYGTVRLDRMNRLKPDVESEESSIHERRKEMKIESEETETDLGYVDRQYFLQNMVNAVEESVLPVGESACPIGESAYLVDESAHLVDESAHRGGEIALPLSESALPCYDRIPIGDSALPIVETTYKTCEDVLPKAEKACPIGERKSTAPAVKDREHSVEKRSISAKTVRSDSDRTFQHPACSGESVSTRPMNSGLNFFDDQLMNMSQSTCSSNDVEPIQDRIRSSSSTKSQTNDRQLDDLNYFDQQILEPYETVPKSGSQVSQQRSSKNGENVDWKLDEDRAQSDDIVVDKLPPRRKLNKSLPRANMDDPQTAYDLSRAVRAQVRGEATEPVDSKGFRILKTQVHDFTREPLDLIANILRNSVVYDDHDIVAIDKPYGLSSQGGGNVHASIDSLLPRLAAMLDRSQSTLYQVHRLDKNTTGVMLFAKSKAMQTRLTGMFRDHKVQKRYWVLAKGAPSPTAGIIDIPMAEGTIEGKYRMVLKPDDTEETRLVQKKSSVDTSRAITKYRVIDTRNSVSLIECEPVTGVKHQVRCHLGFGLNCPVLGDHKYSHFTKLAPQRLHPDTLHQLGIRQAKVRHLPMHLHAKQVALPGIVDGRNLVITTKLPKHFITNMKRLKIRTK